MAVWLVLVAGTAGAAPIPVAITGYAAPGGGTFTTFSAPTINSAGQVAFAAKVTGSPSASGVFSGSAGSLQAIARQGGAAPAGGNYGVFPTSSSTTPPQYLINSSGQVAFIAPLTGGSSTSGIFVGTPGTVQAAALTGAAAPAGGNYSAFQSLVFNNAGQVAFAASLNGGSSTQGVFVGAPGSVGAVAVTGAAAPSGGNYSGFDSFAGFGVGPALDGGGKVIFGATLTGGSSSRGLYVGAPGAVQTAALAGGLTPDGDQYSSFVNWSLNSAGQIAFLAILSDNRRGVYSGSLGAIQSVILSETTSPTGGHIEVLYDPVINSNGQLAISTVMDDGGTIVYAIFTGTPGALQTLVQTSTAAPGGGSFEYPDVYLNMNASGQVALYGLVMGPGVTAANDVGLYAGTVGNLVKIVREGDVIDVDPGPGVDLRTVADGGIGKGFPPSAGQDGRNLVFSDSGLLAYTLMFTDGTSGVFYSQVSPVPEPATALAALGVAALAGGVLVRRRGR
jgi:hypothetical protein